MKILVLTSTYSRWENDTEPKFVDNLCHYLAEEHEVHVLAPHAPGSKTGERLGRVDIFRFRYCLQHWESLAYDGGILPNVKENRLRLVLVPLFLSAQLFALVRLLRKNNYDIIHAHWIIPQGLVATIARPLARSNIPVVLTSHGGDLFSLKGSMLSSLKRWITRKAEKLTVVSSAMKIRASEMALKNEADIAVIPMGVDTHKDFTPTAINEDRQGLLFVGRLVDKKGIEYLIDAMPEVLQQHPEAKLTIIGEGPMGQGLQDRCDSQGTDSQIQFLGARPNHEIPDFLRGTAICIFPSIVTDDGDQEGTPVAVMEALACECAAIISDYPGARDIIHDGVTGLLVAERSSAEIAAKILELLEDAELRRKLGENGRKLVQEKYDWEVISREFAKQFQQLRKKA